MILHFVVLTQYWRVTDGGTDGHTTTAYTALALRRAVKTICRQFERLASLQHVRQRSAARRDIEYRFELEESDKHDGTGNDSLALARS